MIPNRMSFQRSIFWLSGGVLLGGCHISSRLNPDWHVRQEYQQAAQVAPLIVPGGLDSPNTKDALVIPTVELAPPPPGPKDACLDVPPRYKPAPPNKAASQS